MLRDQGQRYLILGMGALAGLTEGELGAILAHEYGHFNHRDTVGGNFVNPVQRSLHSIARNLASAGLATWYNPAWWFVNIYNASSCASPWALRFSRRSWPIAWPPWLTGRPTWPAVSSILSART
jgi:Zn-dependent protease with chaperone function